MSPHAVAAAGLAALAVGMGIGRFAFTPILPLMQASGALTLAGAGWLAAANYAGYLAGALSAPLVPAALGVRAGLAGVAVFTLAMAFAEELAAWIVLRALAGVASAWVLVHVSAWCLERLAGLARPGLGGWVYAGVGAGSVAAGVACLAALEFQRGSEAVWVALGVAALIATVLLWPLFRDSGRPGPAERKVRSNGTALLVVGCYAAFGFGYIIPATFIPALARETLGESTLYAWAWPLFGAAAAASTVAVAPIVRRFGERAVWIAGHFVMAAGVGAPLVLPAVAGIAVCALCVGATFMVITMAGLQEARRIGGARLLAAMTAGFAAGQIAGPAFVALLAHAGGRLEHATLAACLVLVASAVALFFRRTEP
jgi:MFS family permease